MWEEYDCFATSQLGGKLTNVISVCYPFICFYPYSYQNALFRSSLGFTQGGNLGQCAFLAFVQFGRGATCIFASTIMMMILHE